MCILNLQNVSFNLFTFSEFTNILNILERCRVWHPLRSTRPNVRLLPRIKPMNILFLVDHTLKMYGFKGSMHMDVPYWQLKISSRPNHHMPMCTADVEDQMQDMNTRRTIQGTGLRLHAYYTYISWLPRKPWLGCTASHFCTLHASLNQSGWPCWILQWRTYESIEVKTI